jgi:hypothetical protein
MLCVLLAAVPGFGSESDAAIERDVLPGGPGANRLEVDVDLLAEAAVDLSDLRLLSASGDEVPYLLLDQPRAQRSWIHGELLPIRRTRRSSGFEVDLGKIVMVDRIRIEGLPAPFLKRVRIEAGGDRAHWTMLHEQATLFDLPDDGLRLLELDFNPGEYRYLRVVWSDHSSARLPLPKQVTARTVAGNPPPLPLAAKMPFEHRASEPGVSRYRVWLPAPRLPITGFELEVGDSYVLRRARITEARLSGSEIRPHELGVTTLRRVIRDDLVASQMKIAVSAPTETEVEIEIDNGDNKPFELTSVTARFAAQPWIYFESPDGEPLRARYGAPGLSAPLYDLEALRDIISAESLARDVKTARFGETRQFEIVRSEPDLADAVGAGARLDLNGFQVRRGVSDGPTGLNALRLDAGVLAGSSRLRDLRIIDEASTQVPYILESLGEPTILELPELVPKPDNAGAKQSLYSLVLPFASLPEARLTMETTGRVFERQVRLAREEQRNRRDPSIVVTLAQTTWRNSDPAHIAPPLSMQVPALAGEELLVIVDEGDNSPLQIENPRLYLPTYRMRFIRRSAAPLWLVYGKYGLAAPRYDLALLAPRVLGARVPEIGLSEVKEDLPGPKTIQTGSIVFWAALILALLVLVGIVARLLRRPPAEG